MAVTAQHKPLAQNLQPWKPGRLHLQAAPPTGAVTVIPLQDSVKARLYQQQRDRRWIQSGVSSTYSHATVRGKVYTLTPDNMPCLVPDRKAVAPMPNKQQLFVQDRNGRAPIAPIIPEEDNKTKQ